MTERIRLIVDTTDDVRRAVLLRRIKTGAASISDLVNAILREVLAEEIAEVQSYPKIPPPGEQPKKRRKKTD
jgi:hypothetical protein